MLYPCRPNAQGQFFLALISGATMGTSQFLYLKIHIKRLVKAF